MLHSWLETEEEAFGAFALVPLEISPLSANKRPSVAPFLLSQTWSQTSLLLRNQRVFNFQGLWPWGNPGVWAIFLRWIWWIKGINNPGQGLSPEPSAVPDYSEDDLRFEMGGRGGMGINFPWDILPWSFGSETENRTASPDSPACDLQAFRY